MRTQTRVLLAMLLLTSLTCGAFSVVLYRSRQESLLQGVNDKLTTAAEMARAVVGPQYHDHIADASSVSTGDYLRIVDTYNQLCARLGLEYLWSLLLVDGVTVFTSGTATSKDVTRGDFAGFFERHSNPELYARAFQTMQVQYQVNDDKWGRIYAVLIPYRDGRGRPYLFGASMKASQLEHLLWETKLQSLLLTLGVFAVVTVLSTLLERSLGRPIRRLTQVASAIKQGDYDQVADVAGGDEIRSLCLSLNGMREAIRDKIAELNDSRENLSITLHSIGDAVVTTDHAGRVTRLNPVAERLTGWDDSEALGRPLGEVLLLLDVETRERIPSPAEEVLVTGERVSIARDAVLVSKLDRSERIISDSAAPIRSHTGSVVGVVLVFRDVTEQQALEAQLRHAQRMDSIGQLAGGVAHDFNNMLAAIQGSADMLALKLRDRAELSKYLDTIQDATERAADLTRKLLAFSRKAKVSSTPVDVHDVIRRAVDLLGHSIDRRIRIETSFEARVSTVMGDPTQLESALVNLGVNARDAMPGGGTLEFGTRTVELTEEEGVSEFGFAVAPGAYVEINVSDTGTGIPRESLPNIFDPFFTTKEVGKGTGLGLAAVYGTVREHRGGINVYSEEGLGSVFRIYLPIDDSVLPEGEVPHEEVLCGEGVILVVDDESIVRNIASELLRSMDYEVLCAQDGPEALAMLSERPGRVDVVLLDLVMPRMSGRDAFLALRALDPYLPVVFASGFTREAGVADLLDDRTSFIQKPYRRVELSRTIARAAAQRPRATAPGRIPPGHPPGADR